MPQNGIIWGNRDLHDLLTNVAAREDRIIGNAAQIMGETVDEAQDEMATFIEEAVTPTGLARQAGLIKDPHGSRHPGRVSSGNMRDEIAGSVETPDEKTIVGKWGWPDPREYFRYQEDGTGTIGPMHALLQSFINARERLAQRLNNMSGDR